MHFPKMTPIKWFYGVTKFIYEWLLRIVNLHRYSPIQIEISNVMKKNLNFVLANGKKVNKLKKMVGSPKRIM